MDGYEAIVIGSGFGGAINACRLAKRWPGKVLVLERGKRYPMGSFPRTPHDMARNFWNLPYEQHPRPRRIPDDAEAHGMFDIRNYRRMDVVLSAGLGGGSLIYANVFLEPPDQVFDDRWPQTCKKQDLVPYYRVAKEVLGSRPIPVTGDPRRRVIRTELFERIARSMGRSSELVDVNVFFGNDHEDPLPIGHQVPNRYGALQTSCVYSGECDIGCNTHSKNTLDLNYLHVAQDRYDARVLTERLVDRIVPLDGDGREDPGGDGAHGYRVFYRDLTTSGHPVIADDTRRVVVAAGALGSTELLLRCRDVHRTLPRLSPSLGTRFSGNGDFLCFAVEGKDAADPNYGPVITQRIDFGLFEGFDPESAFVMEDASYPALLAWFVEGVEPRFLRLPAVWKAFVAVVRRYLMGQELGSVGYALGDLLSGDLSYRTSVLLCMGLDKSNGVMSLDRQGCVSVDWPMDESMPLYTAIVDASRRFARTAGAKRFFVLPTWYRPLRKNVSVHPLGGCVLADDLSTGVVSARRDAFGQVFGYEGLYVSDGSIVPTAVGANPSATISALSEMVAEGITGTPPDAGL
ncbi:MAG: GMC oxidoreductase [Actinomycetota bacterium]|nr:GMC oxidoreductase [Actinomycetota bacterium]